MLGSGEEYVCLSFTCHAAIPYPEISKLLADRDFAREGI